MGRGAHGRRVIQPNRAGQLVFYWQIQGWEHVKSATIAIYPRNSDRPICVEPVSSATGSVETYGTLAGVRLSTQDRANFPNDVYTGPHGPYLARITINAVKPDVTVVIPARRLYFEVLTIAVIGAGAAGLRAASTILENHCSVVLIEARDRFGGRAYTINMQDWTIDLGCQWLHSSILPSEVKKPSDQNNKWVPFAPQGTFPHRQESVTLIKGQVTKDANDLFQKMYLEAEGALESDPGSLSPGANAKDLLKLKLEKLVTEILEKERNARIGQRLGDWKQSFRPQDDTETAKGILERRQNSIENRKTPTDESKVEKFQQDLEKDKNSLAALLKDDGWKKDERILNEILKIRRERESKRIEETEPPIRLKEFLESQRVQLILRLAFAHQADLEEAIEAEWFAADARYGEEDAELPDSTPNVTIDKENEEEDEGQGHGQHSEASVSDDEDSGEKKVREEEQANEEEQAPREQSEPRSYVNLMPNGGYGNLVQTYGENLCRSYSGNQLLLLSCCPATKITWSDPNLITIATNRSDIGCHAVVVTVPTDIINKEKLQFDPPLPTAVKNAFANLPMGHYKKVFLHFNLDCFAKVEWKGCIAPDTSPENHIAYWLLDLDGRPWKFLDLGKRRVIGFIGGKEAGNLDALSDSELMSIVLGALSQGLGLKLSKDNVISLVTSKWSQEPYSLGAYAFTKPGGTGARKLLARCTVGGRLRFAGEAIAEEEYGNCHIAFESGESAATKLAAALLEGFAESGY